MDIVDGFIDENNKFIFSGEDSRLESYECFHDPSSEKLIDGLELLDLQKKNNEGESHRRWLYFYRPYNYGNIIGRKQKKLISDKELAISDRKNTIDDCKVLKILFLIFSSIIIISFYEISMLISIPTLLATLYFHLEEKELIKKIFIIESEIELLNREVNYLLDQQEKMKNSRKSAKGIEEDFWKDLRDLEGKYTTDISGKKIEKIREENELFYKNITAASNTKHEFPTFPVIPSWGMLQQSKKFNPNTHKHQSTGIKIASKYINEKIATWRRATNKEPIFRLWYVQFLFFHDKNLTVQSFYYDFITKKQYGESLEIYQYNHITNYSYVDEDISYMVTDLLLEGVLLPEKLTQNIFCDEVKTLSFSSASGSHYRCVIPDNDVMKGLDLWLKYKRSEREAKKSIKDYEEKEEDVDPLDDDEKNEMLNILDEYHNTRDKYKGLIETLAWLSFKKLREKVAQFALIEGHNIEEREE